MEADFASIDTIETIKNNISGRAKEIAWKEVIDVFDLSPGYIDGCRVEALFAALVPLPEEKAGHPGMIDADRVTDYGNEVQEKAFGVAAAIFDIWEIDKGQRDAVEAIEQIKKLIVQSGIFCILPRVKGSRAIPREAEEEPTCANPPTL